VLRVRRKEEREGQIRFVTMSVELLALEFDIWMHSLSGEESV